MVEITRTLLFSDPRNSTFDGIWKIRMREVRNISGTYTYSLHKILLYACKLPFFIVVDSFCPDNLSARQRCLSRKELQPSQRILFCPDRSSITFLWPYDFIHQRRHSDSKGIKCKYMVLSNLHKLGLSQGTTSPNYTEVSPSLFMGLCLS